MEYRDKKLYVGLDLGTSAVKCVALSPDGETVKAKVSYKEISENGWAEAAFAALCEISEKTKGIGKIAAIGLSSQVGTYIVDDTVIPWNGSAGREELQRIKAEATDGEFLAEISMNHPDLISYPLPRLLYIKEHITGGRAEGIPVIMPKESLTQRLCGRIVSDPFSYRGLTDFKTGQLSAKMLKKWELSFALPELIRPTQEAGGLTAEAARRSGIAEGTPVIVGCNDFFAGLLGMGITKPDRVFDLSGTSEHIGVVGREIVDTDMVSGPYFEGFCTYGGTKSSGVSCDFAIRQFTLNGLSEDADPHEILDRRPPLFLPYLNGERAPIFDEDARGVFFGISAGTDRREMAYAVLEGVVFSLYDIYLRIGSGIKAAALITGGGSAGNRFMARLKAELFGMEVQLAKETDTSAVGAAMLAMVGCGEYESLDAAAAAVVAVRTIASPKDARLRERLLQRFALYRRLYQDLKNDFAAFGKLN